MCDRKWLGPTQAGLSVCSALEETCLSPLSCFLPYTSPDVQGHGYRSMAVLCGQSGHSSWTPVADGSAGSATRPSAWDTTFWRVPPVGKEELDLRASVPVYWASCDIEGNDSGTSTCPSIVLSFSPDLVQAAS